MSPSARKYRLLSPLAAACALAALLLGGCAGVKKEGDGPVAAPLRAPTGPANAPVPRRGALEPIPLDEQQRAQLRDAVAAAPRALRPRLRYALALGDDGKRHLVVYDGRALDPTGRGAANKHDYVVFLVLNATDGEHYDPQQNAIVGAIATAQQPESAVVR